MSDCHDPRYSRRAFLAALGALAPAAALAAKPKPKPARQSHRPYRVDVHHHIVPPALAEAHAGLEWSRERSLDEMNSAGVVMGITSIPQPAIVPGENAARIARECNDFAAKLRAGNQTRFGMFAALPLPDVEASAREAEYALGPLRADGVTVSTSYGDKAIGDPEFAPLLEAFGRRRALVFVHPPLAPCCGAPTDSAALNAQVTRALASVLFSGAAARHPEIRWIFAYGGGVLPSAYQELQRMEQSAPDRAREALPGGLKSELQKLHYEAAGLGEGGGISALLGLVPPSQVLYGSDFPFSSGAAALEALKAGKYRYNELRLMERDNAMRLMPRIALLA